MCESIFYRAVRHNGKPVLARGDFGTHAPSMDSAKHEAHRRNMRIIEGIGITIERTFARLNQAAELKARRRARDAAKAHATPAML